MSNNSLLSSLKLQKFFLSLLLLMPLLMSGCGPRYVDYFPYHDSGISKPSIVILPIANTSDANYNWNLAQEIEDGLHYRLMDNARIFVYPTGQTVTTFQKCGNPNLFGKDISFANSFHPSEFVVAIELIDHSIVPYEKGKFTPLYPTHSQMCNYVLTMKLRIRMIDIRGNEPTIVLQEIFQSNHMIPMESDRIDYSRAGFGTQSFKCTPMGIAHQRLINDLSKRLENTAYIWR